MRRKGGSERRKSFTLRKKACAGRGKSERRKSFTHKVYACVILGTNLLCAQSRKRAIKHAQEREGNMSLLKIQNLYTSYGRINALKGISLELEAGEIISLVGSNGAGKSTLLASITGIVPAMRGQIIFDGKDITHRKPSEIVHQGISLSMEGRGVFPRLTVEENLRVGAYTRKSKEEIKVSMEANICIGERQVDT